MQHNENQYIILARIEQTSRCFQTYFRRTEKQAKQNILSCYSIIQTKLSLKHFEFESQNLKYQSLNIS